MTKFLHVQEMQPGICSCYGRPECFCPCSPTTPWTWGLQHHPLTSFLWKALSAQRGSSERLGLIITFLRSSLILSCNLCFGLANVLHEQIFPPKFWINLCPPCKLYVKPTYRTDRSHNFPIIGPQLKGYSHLEGLLVSARQQPPVPTQILLLSL